MTNLQQLYTSLFKAKLININFDKFAQYFENDKYKRQVYDVISNRKMFTKSFESFDKAFSLPDVEALETKVGVDKDGNDIMIGGKVSQEKNTWLEDTFGKNSVTDLFGDMYRAGKQGWAAGRSVDEALEVYKKGRNLSDQDLQAFLDANERMREAGVSDEMLEYNKIAEEEGGGIFGVLKAFANNPTIMPQVIVSSFSQMLGSAVDSEEVLGTAAASSGAGAAAGAAIGSTGFSLGPLGALTTAGGAVSGAVGGFFGGLTGVMETGNTLAQLLQEEIGEDVEMTKENVRAILEDPDRFENLKNRAVARGLTIGAIEGLTAGLSRGVGASMVSGAGKKALTATAKKRLATGVAVGEMTAGAGGEFLGQKAAGQDTDLSEIFLEGIAEAKGVANVADILAKKSYTLNGGKASRKDIESFLNDKNVSNADKAKAKIEIEGDKSLQEFVNNVQGDALIESQIDEKITDQKDRDKLVELEIERSKAERDSKKKGALAVPGAKKNLENIESQINELLGKYEGAFSFGESETAVDVQQARIKGSIEFAEKEGAKIGKKVNVLDNDNAAQAAYDQLLKEGKVKESKNVKGTDGFIVGDQIYINKEVAGRSGAISVGSHELLHGIIGNSFGKLDTDARAKLGKSFMNMLTRQQRRAVERRLKNSYGIEGDAVFQSEEMFTVFSDAIAKNEITFNEGVFSKIGNAVEEVLRKLSERGLISKDSFLFRKEFSNGRQVYNFLKEYNKNIKAGKLGERATAFAAVDQEATGVVKKSMTASQRAEAKNEIDKLGAQSELGDNYRQEGGKFLFDADVDNVISEIKNKGYLNGLIAAKYKGDRVPVDFVDKVFSELTSHIKNFNPETNDSLFGWINSQLANKAGNVYNREYKATQTDAGRARDIGETTQEGEVKVQVAAEKDTALEALETEDLSVAGQARAKAKRTERQSKLRRQFGFETGGNMYNKVLNSAKKSILLAYRKTQSITDPAKRARAIKDLLRKEYFTSGLTSDLFKDIKNFLGTKDYIKNLKQYREAIVESMSTADLVQIERKVPDNERIFTVFDRKLTKIEDVVDAVDKGLLPTEAINTIKKGTAVNLYRKRMPTEQELVSFADQPAINPVTGARSGLKGTRKDGFAKAISNTLVLDAVMEVRQSEGVVEALEDDAVAQLDLMALSDAVGREVDVKFSKSTAVVDIDNAVDNSINLAVYSQIKFSRSHREAYEARLTKKRTDLDEKQIKGAVESIFKFVEGENIPNNKKAKFEKMAMHYMANGYLILPEDGYKVIEAERIATIKKIDPFSYKNPNLLIEKFAGEVKGARTNPDTVKEFTNKTDVSSGVTVYDVADSKEGQLAVRKVIDTHFGRKANPWCLCSRNATSSEFYVATVEAETKQEADIEAEKAKKDGYNVEVYKSDLNTYEVIILEKADEETALSASFTHWKSYNKEGNGYKIAFKDGKLLCFRDGNKKQWWDRNDKASDKIHFTVTEKKGNVESVYDITPENGTKVLTRRTEGQMPTAKVYTRSEDNNYIYESNVKYVDGAQESSIIETTYKDKRLSQGVGIYDGANPDIQLNNITKDVRTIKNNLKTSVYEGKVVLTSKQFKKFEDEVVKIEHVTNAQSSENISLTINGVKQDIDVKFSKSAAEVNYNKAANNVKFSLTSDQSRKKLQPYISKKADDAKDQGLTSVALFYETLGERIQEGDSLQEAYSVAHAKAFPGFAKSTFQLDENLIPNVENVDTIEKNVKEFYVPQIREFAKKVSLKWYKRLIDSMPDNDAKFDIINNFLINFGRPIRSGKVLNITTNRELLKEMKKAFGSIMDNYDLVSVEAGEKVMLKGKDIDLYQSVTPIKTNPAKYVEKSIKQAKIARKWLNDILESNLSNGEKKALVQLGFYGQKGPGRKLSPIGFYVEGLRSSEAVLEHDITADELHNAIIDRIDGKIKDTELNKILDEGKVHIIPVKIDDIMRAAKKVSKRNYEGYSEVQKAMDFLEKLYKKGELKGDVSSLNFSKSDKHDIINRAVLFSRSSKNATRGITILDFDDTLATSKSLVKFTRPDGSKGTLTPEQYASTYEDLADLGYEFDFSEFSKVVDGKPAPLLNKAKKLAGKFGTKDMFVLTARPADSAPAIREFLKQNGLDIPLKNITGLGNSTSEAKALWVADKVADGYNDFYFADDALKNVQAVQNMLDQFDVKSKVQQARVKFSKTLKSQFNQMIEQNKGVEASRIFSEKEAAKLGKKRGIFNRRFFVPPSADDFVGLLRYFIGKGKKGEADMAFFKKALLDPFARAYREMNMAKMAIMNDFKELRKQSPEVVKKLGKLIPGTVYTYDNAIRVYLFDSAGFDIPGLSDAEVTQLSQIVVGDPELMAFASNLGKISRAKEGYLAPSETWDVENIAMDMQNAVDRIGREKYLKEWNENVAEIFDKDNLNKIEAVYGTDVREALEDMLYAMKTGRNRPVGNNRIANQFMNWINNSIGAIMFFNMRSAVLQMISVVNFLNFEENNIFAAAKMFANQKQYWKDFSFLFNSDFLQARRAGLSTNVNEAELANAVAGAKNKALAALRYLLKLGFTPTQIADSFAIASGGATYYRGRVNKYTKEGLSEAEAKKKAFLDFQEIAEETQQSSRPDRISMQQRSLIGRLILAFANTPMQMARLTKKAAQDLIAGRGDWRSNVSRILYYGAVQNIIFAGLQNAIFALAFDDEELETDEDYEKAKEKQENKTERIFNGALDSLLRGSGIYGAVVATLKNTIKKFAEERGKDWKADYGNVVVELLNLSPSIGSKFRKIYSAMKNDKYNKNIYDRMGYDTLDNPIYQTISLGVEGTTNIPINRMLRKVDNIKASFDEKNSAIQRIFVALGWDQWSLGIDTYEEVDKAREELKQEKKEQKEKEKTNKQEALENKFEQDQKRERKQGKKNITCSAVTSTGVRCKRKPVKGGKCTIHEKVETINKKRQCKRRKADGTRCKMMTNSKSQLCYYHD